MMMYFASKNNSRIDLIFDGSFIQVYLLSLDHQPGTLMYRLSFSPKPSLGGLYQLALSVSLSMLHLLSTLLIASIHTFKISENIKHTTVDPGIHSCP